MSLRAMVWALELQDARLTPAAKFVLVAICDAAHEDKKIRLQCQARNDFQQGQYVG